MDTTIEPGFGGQKFQPSAIVKVQQLMAWKQTYGGHFKVMVDGGMNGETARLVRGADVLVAGTFLFKHEHSVALGAKELLQ